jgi:hypothetical protein
MYEAGIVKVKRRLPPTPGGEKTTADPKLAGDSIRTTTTHKSYERNNPEKSANCISADAAKRI